MIEALDAAALFVAVVVAGGCRHVRPAVRFYLTAE
jgi:hypothetical protein